MSGTTQKDQNPIDWQRIRARLRRADAAIEEALNPTPERSKAIMDARARALAQVEAPPRPPGASIEVVRFSLGNERYAIETRFVREAVRLAGYTPVPGIPGHILGVANLRGTVTAVVDLHELLNLPRTGLTDLTRLVVLGTDRAEFGIIADEVQGQIVLATEDILDPPRHLSEIGRAYLRGVTREAVIVLDGAVLLKDDRLIINEQKGAAHG